MSFLVLFVFIVRPLVVKLEVYPFLVHCRNKCITQNECVYCIFLVGERKRHESLLYSSPLVVSMTMN